jgi:hypothetical protein
MTKEEFAKHLDGRKYGNILTPEDHLDANLYGLIVVHGASDDILQFGGALVDELGAWNGGTFYYDFELESFMDIDDSFEGVELENALTIIAKWNFRFDDEFMKYVPWTYETNIPHAKFNILNSDGGGVFCEGLVIDIKDLK